MPNRKLKGKESTNRLLQHLLLASTGPATLEAGTFYPQLQSQEKTHRGIIAVNSGHTSLIMQLCVFLLRQLEIVSHLWVTGRPSMFALCLIQHLVDGLVGGRQETGSSQGVLLYRNV